jgi:uncharacterized protein (TIGR03790 family)
MKNKLSSVFFMAALTAAELTAQPDRVLVIHNTNSAFGTDSLDVAQYYRTRRGIPAANLCGINFPSNVSITEAQWLGGLRNAVRACLDAAGRTNILYVVMSHQTPYVIQRPSPAADGSLDSYIADVWDANSAVYFPSIPSGSQRYFMNAQSAGNVYSGFLTLAAYRLQPRSQLVYSVWRLDGATPAVAKDLVNKAVDTEAAGGLLAGPPPAGRVYVDNTYQTLNASPDEGFASGEFDLERMARMSEQAGLPLTQDRNQAEFGVAPAPLMAPDAMLYSGFYSLNNYNNVFGWKPGAVGWHLDSSSLTNPRGGSSWSARAIQEGITITSGSISEPFLFGLAHPDVVVRHLYQGGTVGDAFLRGTPWLKWKIINMGDPLYRPFPGGVAPFNSPAFTEASLRVNPTATVSQSVQFVITLKDPAPVGGQVVNWTNNYTPYYVSALPSTTLIPEGQRTGTVTLSMTSPVPNDFRGVIVRATYNSTTLQNSVLVYTQLGPILLAAGSQSAGGSLIAAVTLNESSPLAGTVVNLTSSHPAILQVPTSVTVPGGVTTKVFNISTTPGSVTSPTNVTITATTPKSQVTAIVVVRP